MSQHKDGKSRDNRDGKELDEEIEFVEKLIYINRVTKVVKGGKRMGFVAIMVVGDQAGRVGYGHERAREVSEAMIKAADLAKRSLIRVPLKEGRTLHHPYEGHHGAGHVIVRPAVPGTGIIAGGAVRAVFEALGVQDVVAKSIGSSNPYNMIGAIFNALRSQESPRMVAQRRGKSVREVLCHRLWNDEVTYGG